MQKHQRGSMLGFVVVGALLAIAVVGGIYLVKNQLDGNMPGLPGGNEVAVVEDEIDQTDEGTSSDEDQTSESTDTQPDHTGDQPAEDRDDAVVEDETGPSDDAVVDDTEDQADIPQTGVDTEDVNDNLPQTGVDVDELPQTGIADGFYTLVAGGALTGSVVAFRRSNNL